MFRNPAEKEGFQDVQIPCREEGVKMFRYPAGKEECKIFRYPAGKEGCQYVWKHCREDVWKHLGCRDGGVSRCLETKPGRRSVKMF